MWGGEEGGERRRDGVRRETEREDLGGQVEEEGGERHS